MKKLIIFVVMSFAFYSITIAVSSDCFAGTVYGPVTSVVVRASDGLVYVTVGGTASGQPACATHSYWMVKDENSNAGKQQIAALLAALASKSYVTLVGANTCTRYGDGEDINSVIAY